MLLLELIMSSTDKIYVLCGVCVCFSLTVVVECLEIPNQEATLECDACFENYKLEEELNDALEIELRGKPMAHVHI